MVVIIIICLSLLLALFGINYIDKKSSYLGKSLKEVNILLTMTTRNSVPAYAYTVLKNKLQFVKVIKGVKHTGSYPYDYIDGYLKLFLGGGTALQIRCNEQEVKTLLEPIKEIIKSEEIDDIETEIIIHCKENKWESWDAYKLQQI